jgi:hypothetical protein
VGTPGRVSVQKRLERGESQDCAHSHHERCVVEGCVCQCHRDPEAFKRRQQRDSAAAAKAWQTRRGGGEHATPAPETPPNRPEIKAGHKAALPAAAGKQIKSEFSLLLYVADQGAARLVPRQWTTPEDRLTDDERTLLVNSTYAYLESTALGRRLLQMLFKVSESAPLAQLVYTVAMVAAPRLAHHQVIPPELASAIVFAPILFAQSAAADGPDTSTSPAVGAEPAPQPDRPDWHREVDAGGIPFTVPPVQGGAPDQTGFGPLRHAANGQNGEVARGHPV